MAKGTVKWFSDRKGYGFIQPDDRSKDVFVHRNETPGQSGLHQEQRVSFMTEVAPKGPQAKDVQPL